MGGVNEEAGGGPKIWGGGEFGVPKFGIWGFWGFGVPKIGILGQILGFWGP